MSVERRDALRRASDVLDVESVELPNRRTACGCDTGRPDKARRLAPLAGDGGHQARERNER